MQPLPLSSKSLQDDKFLNALADAYRLQESIISTTELSIISTSLDGIITSFNKAAENLTGYTAEEMIGKFSPEILHDKDEIKIRANTKADSETGFKIFISTLTIKDTPDRSEWTYVRKDSSRFPVLLSTTALRDEKDSLIGYAIIASDITEQKKFELKIKESDAHLQALVTSLDEIVLEVNNTGSFINFWTNNEHSYEALRDEYGGKTIYQVFDNTLSKTFEQAIQHVQKTKKSGTVDYPFGEPNENHWRLARFSYVNETHVLICIRDITQQKIAELGLQQSEQKFRLLAENVPGAIYLCRNDATFSMIYLNDKVEEITGYPAQEFISGEMNFVKLYHAEDAPEIFKKVEQALAEKRSFTLEYRIHHRSSEIRWIKEVGIGLYNSNNNQDCFMIEGLITDITAQKQGEEEFRQITEENHRVFNHAFNLSVIAGFDGYFKKLNPAWSALLGWTDEELKSRIITELLHPDDVVATRNALKHITNGNNLRVFENRYRCKDGSYRWLLWSSSSDVERQLIYASAIDITERKISEEELLRSKSNLEVAALELQEQNRQLDEFAHIISHNLRSPIGNIKALIGLLDDSSNMDDYKVIFAKLKNVAGNLSETMNELMETIKVKKNVDVEFVEIRFKEMLDKVIQSLEGELIQSKATLTFNFNNAPKIDYSKTYMESIFQNLISNAIRYRSPERNPEIHIESNFVDDKIQLLVRDNGLGIDLDRYGDKLFGLHKTFHANKEARGVGLFLTKTQIEAMGGSITIKSKVEEGTTFIIQF